MKIYAMWHGGSSYAAPDNFRRRDVESFPSLQAAIVEFRHRASGRDSYYPAVDESSEMMIYRADPYRDSDAYPDLLLRVGPRGGVIRERC